MKILWITNVVFPEAQFLLTGNGALKASGGWLLGAAEALINMPGMKLVVASLSQQVKSLTRLEGDKISYYLLPYGKGNTHLNHKYEHLWRQVRDAETPDVIHIHGTEFSHGLAYVRACGAGSVVASIQGMISEIWKYKTDGLTPKDIINNLTLSDVLLKQSFFHKVKKSRMRGKNEIELIKALHHVIGRTTWDRANIWAVNSDIHYHFCNETLRPEFYCGSWSLENCAKHTIFCNQPTNPIKGFHQLLKALPLVIKFFPDTKVYLSGTKGLEPNSIKQKFLENGYIKYLRKLITKNKLENHLFFLGPLSAEEMKQEYLSANVFVSCSSIENSSNSIGEAQILGTPCISSYVGGVSDMIVDGVSGFLYRFEETNTLAYYICKIFSGDVDLEQLSRKEIEIASARHNPSTNSQRLIDIYKSILKNG